MKGNGRIVCLVGQIASGKTTLAGYLAEHGFERVVTYTTRPPRPGEENGRDYHFIAEEEFLEKTDAGFFAEYTDYSANFGHVYYGTSKESLETPDGVNKVIVLNPAGVMTLKNAGYDIFVVYLDFGQETLMRRALQRGDHPVEIGRRIAEDTHLFWQLETGDYVDLRISNSDLLPKRLGEWIQNVL